MSTRTAQAAELKERTRITVALESNPYDVIIGSSMVGAIGTALNDLSIRSGTKILVVSNPDVAGPYGLRYDGTDALTMAAAAVL